MAAAEDTASIGWRCGCSCGHVDFLVDMWVLFGDVTALVDRGVRFWRFGSSCGDVDNLVDMRKLFWTCEFFFDMWLLLLTYG